MNSVLFWDGPKEIADSNAVFITTASQAEEAVKAVEAAVGAAIEAPQLAPPLSPSH